MAFAVASSDAVVQVPCITHPDFWSIIAEEVKRAEALEERAEEHLEITLAKLERFGERADESHLSDQQWLKQARKLRSQLDQAQMLKKEAENRVLETKLEARDAEIELLLLQWGYSVQQLDAALDLARRSHNPVHMSK